MSLVREEDAAGASTQENARPVRTRELRRALAPYRRKRTMVALALVAIDVMLFASATVAVIAAGHLAIKLLASCAVAVAIARLFILGHDACHQSLTAYRGLNRAVGRLAFLPSLTPFSLWEVGHNLNHHGFTNLRGRDPVWAPLSPEEFRQLPRARQWLERIYRSGWGTGLYYFIELWWRKLFFPNRQHVAVHRPIFRVDCHLVLGAAVAWVLILAAAARATQQSPFLIVGLGLLLPFLLWNWMMGFLIYVHHTHPQVRWHGDVAAWQAAHPLLRSTVSVRLPRSVGALLHNIMDHPAHHLDVGIPLYNLAAAQKKLEEIAPGAFLTQDFSWSWYWDCVRQCKTYDYRAGAWSRA